MTDAKREALERIESGNLPGAMRMATDGNWRGLYLACQETARAALATTAPSGEDNPFPCNCQNEGRDGHHPLCFSKDTAPSGEVEIQRLVHVIDRDRYVAASALNAIKAVTRGREWLREGGRGNYAYDDEQYQAEFAAALDEIDAALGPLRHLAADKSDCTVDPQKVQEARSAAVELLAAAPKSDHDAVMATDAAVADAIDAIAMRCPQADWFAALTQVAAAIRSAAIRSPAKEEQ